MTTTNTPFEDAAKDKVTKEVQQAINELAQSYRDGAGGYDFEPSINNIVQDITQLHEAAIAKAREEEHNFFAGAIFALTMVGEKRAANSLLETLERRKEALRKEDIK